MNANIESKGQIEKELITLAKYPFLDDTRKYVESLRLSLGELIEHPLYSEAVNLGEQRILDLMKNKFRLNADNRLSTELAILSYPIARIIVNLTENKNIISRYGRGEANHTYHLMKYEDRKTIERIKKDLKFRVKENRIQFKDYLSLSSELARTNPQWKLVNRTLDGGYIKLNKNEDLVLLGEAVRLKTIEPIRIRNPPKKLVNASRKIKVALYGTREERIKTSRLDQNATPPCISHMLTLLKSGDATHNVWFILATFFIGLGLDTEAIIEVFLQSPKFNEKKSRYQLRFLTGESGSVKYSCPSCVKIKSYGFCKAECNVRHPLQYYRDRMGVRKTKRVEKTTKKGKK